MTLLENNNYAQIKPSLIAELLGGVGQSPIKLTNLGKARVLI